MGEAKRRKKLGLPTKKNNIKKKVDQSPRVFDWLPITVNQKNSFIRLSIRGGWFGIAILVIVWVVVRFVGPAAGWWTPADSL